VRRRAVAALAAASLWCGLGAGSAAALNIVPVANPLGIEAFVVEDHTERQVAFAFDFVGGSSQDPGNRRGVTNVLVGLFNEGPAALDPAAYQARLKELSVQIGFEFDRDSLWGVVLAPTANREAAARLLGDTLAAPHLDTATLDGIRGLVLDGVRRSSANRNALLAFQAALFPGHIYGVWESGDETSLTAIAAADLEAYRARVLGRDHLKVVAIGDIDAATFAPMLELAFARLPATADLRVIADAPPPKPGRIDATAAVAETSVRFGGPAPRRADPDYIAAALATEVLGAREGPSRLRAALVERDGLTRNVSVALETTAYGAWFAGSATASPDKAGALVAGIEREARTLAAEGPTLTELAHARQSLVLDLVARFDTLPAAAAEMVDSLAAGLGTGYTDAYVDGVVGTTTEDVRRAAERMFGAGLLVYTLGPAPPAPSPEGSRQ
jgi:zinc protease